MGGGISTERHVSLVSSASVCRALRSLGHQAVFVDIYLGLEDVSGPLDALFDAPDGLCGNVSIETSVPDLNAVIASRRFKSPSRLGKNVLEICSLADCVFLGLHGADGEDGKIQAVLELIGVPYTGSPPLGSAMAMDKSVAKKIMREAGILTPKSFEITCRRGSDLDELCSSLPVPCVLKAVSGGSSIGVAFPETRGDLSCCLADVCRYDSRILVEERIIGREFTVPVLGDKYLNPIEIIPPDGSTFDYVAKYQSGAAGAREICPADITPEEKQLLGETALKFHRALGLSVYSRTDFILDSQGCAYCLEINTLPGMTPNSLIPKSAKLEGLDYPRLCEKIVELSLAERGN